MSLGVMMLDTAFTRYPGDIGAPATFRGAPVLHECVAGADVARIVGITDDAFVEPFVAAGKRLVDRGATLLTTSCGFLVVYQAALSRRLPVPVATSALLLIPEIEQTCPPGTRTGVLTFSAAHLRAPHLAAAGARQDTPVAGLDPDSGFARAIRGEAVADSPELRAADASTAARALVERHPEVGAVVLECTNFPPHRSAIAAACGRPVYDLWDLLTRWP
jgi:hypothetical protein